MKQKKNDKIAEPYTAQVRKTNRVTDAVLAVLCLALGGFFIYSGITGPYDTTAQLMGQIVRWILVPVLMYFGIVHYPHYVYDRIDVDGDKLKFRNWLKKGGTVRFRDLDVYAEREDMEARKSNASHAVTVVYNNVKYRLPVSFCEEGETFLKDLKAHGTAVKKV